MDKSEEDANEKSGGCYEAVRARLSSSTVIGLYCMFLTDLMVVRIMWFVVRILQLLFFDSRYFSHINASLSLSLL
jgi:hypothetical protein